MDAIGQRKLFLEETLGSVLLVLLTLVVLVLSYLLFMPISISLHIRRYEKTSAASAIRMFPFRITLLPYKEKQPSPRPKKRRPEKAARRPSERRARFNVSRVSADDMHTVVAVMGASLRYAGRLLKSPDRGNLSLNLLGGTSEPDVTGQIYGAVQAIRPVLPPSIAVSYNPDFMAGKFSGDLSIRLVVRIFTIAKETVIFIFELPILRIIRLYRKYRKGGTDAK